MGRSRRYANEAERQRAYRQRVAARQHDVPAAPSACRRPSRPTRLAAVQSAVQQLHAEYEQWLASIPESLEDTDPVHRLSETVEQLEAVLDLLAEIQPPRGFGRD